jgi:transposase
MRGTRFVEKVVTLDNGRVRRFRTTQQRREIVEETLKPGASIALIARAHDVNTNQVFKWRRQYDKGELEIRPKTTLLPVKVSDTISDKPVLTKKRKPERRGIIDIDLGHARVRIEGAADAECVRSAIESLCR